MRMTAAEYRLLTGQQPEKQPSKMRNVKTVVDGIKFDSRAEANRYCELKLLMRAGEVTDIVLQPRYLLQEAFEKDGVRYRKMEYVADFLVTYADGRQEIEDVKGHKTRTYRDKRKLFEKRYPHLKIIEITS